MKIKHLLPLILIGIALTRVSGTTVIPPTFEQLVQQAEFIFQGTVTNTQSVWVGEGAQRHIETYVTFQVEENVKGQAGSSYTIQMLGGTVGDETFEITDTPKFKAGDRDILFVEHNNDQFVPLVGISYGRFHVQRDEQTGRDVLLTNEGEAVRDLTQLGRNQKAATIADVSQAITPDALKAAVHQQLGDSAGRLGR
ncbi:MAG TPA: hypothetical protein VKS98_12355 [Chthoniobacterales bacterium]|nr:hypothetical protein [Chthoniobacterales bacterium]